MDRRGFLTVTAKMLAAVTIPPLILGLGNVNPLFKGTSGQWNNILLREVRWECQFVTELRDYDTTMQVSMIYKRQRYLAVLNEKLYTPRDRREAETKMKYLLLESASSG